MASGEHVDPAGIGRPDPADALPLPRRRRGRHDLRSAHGAQPLVEATPIPLDADALRRDRAGGGDAVSALRHREARADARPSRSRPRGTRSTADGVGPRSHTIASPMKAPTRDRPHLPKGYIKTDPKGLLSWTAVEEQLH